jgi:exodeoxyribonuclease VII large subunit
MEVLVTGSVEVYAEAGRLNLRPWEITVLGEGERALQREQLRAELEARGWFEETHKQALPAFPTRVGVVTSLDGDARYDIEESIHSRDPSVEIVIQDARVQGEHAAESVANAIHTLDREGGVDVIVVGRGGGSETDLQAFDTEAVAEAVFTAGTPVVAAVGHREDEPLVEGVADAKAITPTEAGATVVPDREQVDEHLADLAAELNRTYEATVTRQVETHADRLEAAYTTQVRSRLRELDRQLADAYAETERRAAEQAATQRYRRAVIVLAALVVALLLLLVGVVVVL